MTKLELFYAWRTYTDLVDETCRAIREARENGATEETLERMKEPARAMHAKLVRETESTEEA